MGSAPPRPVMVPAVSRVAVARTTPLSRELLVKRIQREASIPKRPRSMACCGSGRRARSPWPPGTDGRLQHELGLAGPRPRGSAFHLALDEALQQMQEFLEL